MITDSKANAKWVMTGTWDRRMEAAQVTHVDESDKGKPVFETGPHFPVWEKRPVP